MSRRGLAFTGVATAIGALCFPVLSIVVGWATLALGISSVWELPMTLVLSIAAGIGLTRFSLWVYKDT